MLFFGYYTKANSGGLSENEILLQQEWENQQVELVKIEADIKRAEKLNGTWQGQCVMAVRKFLNIGRESGVAGMAKNTPINSNQPEAGAIVKLDQSKYGHLAVVLKVADNQIYIYESNYNWTERARTKWIDKDDPKIMGYLILN